MQKKAEQKELDTQSYHVLREKGTESPFTGKYLDHKEKGMYTCKGCGLELFSSDTKFDSGSGWPSFTDVARSSHVKLIEDLSHGMRRVEVQCARCSGHLGHVFNDGPKPTNLRYCINSLSLKFENDSI